MSRRGYRKANGIDYPTEEQAWKDWYYFPKAIQDMDGNWYDAVACGEQVWMADNWNSTKYPNGATIPAAQYARRNLNNGPVNHYSCAIAIQSVFSSSNPSGVQGCLPQGWHIPSKAEFNELVASDPDNVIRNQYFYDADSKVGYCTSYNTVRGGKVYYWVSDKSNNNSYPYQYFRGSDYNFCNSDFYASIRGVSDMKVEQFKKWYYRKYGLISE